jgi:hypothetical protein
LIRPPPLDPPAKAGDALSTARVAATIYFIVSSFIGQAPNCLVLPLCFSHLYLQLEAYFKYKC